MAVAVNEIKARKLVDNLNGSKSVLWSNKATRHYDGHRGIVVDFLFLEWLRWSSVWRQKSLAELQFSFE